MAEREFNLLYEPWIRVMRIDGVVEEVSLTTALLKAHEYQGLAGELPTQDAAVLRVLLALLHAVFGRVDSSGSAAPIEDEETAFDRWEELWTYGRFPEASLNVYFRAQQENFWLFHPQRPFWQISSAVIGTEYKAPKLNGALSESNNKIRLFSERNGEEKQYLSFAEAARWLLHVNAFDDTSAKASKEGKAGADGKMPSPGAGWLGKIGYVCVTGSTLFETLMLNLVLLDNDGQPWSSCTPAWELETPRANERTEIPVPHDQAALLTLQSRRLILHETAGAVTSFHLLGGDFFDRVNAFAEQMTVWGAVKDSKGNVIAYQPKRHDRARQMWRNLAAYIPMASNVPLPGVVLWNMRLQKQRILPPDRVMTLAIASVQYGDKDFFVADVYADTLALHYNLLTEVGAIYRLRITDMIKRADTVAYYVGQLAGDLFLASGGDTEKRQGTERSAIERYYFDIDVPFRKWLAGLDANDSPDQREDKINAWCETMANTAYRMALKMEKDAGRPAYIGKTVAVSKEKKTYYSSSLAMQAFKNRMRKLEKTQEVNV